MEGGKSWNQLSAFSLEDPENELELPEVGTPSDMRSDKLFKDYKAFADEEKCFDGGDEDCPCCMRACLRGCVPAWCVDQTQGEGP